jgi:hypothetical protein
MAVLAYFLVSVTLVVAGLSISVQPADGQSSAPSAGLASMRARLIGPNGALLVVPRRDTELHAGALSAAEMPELLELARECVALFGRIVAGPFVTGASSSAMSFVLRREGIALRGTATGSRNVPITIEFVKDGP